MYSRTSLRKRGLWSRVLLCPALGLVPGVLLLLGAASPTRRATVPKAQYIDVCALDLSKGKIEWWQRHPKLCEATLELYSNGLVVYGNYHDGQKADPIFYDAESGKRLPPFDPAQSELIAKSAIFSPARVVLLHGGWILEGFSPGNSKTLRFFNAQRGGAIWEIRTTGYPHEVRGWRDLVIWAYSYLSNEGVIYAYRAEEAAPVWKADLNKIVRGQGVPLTRISLEVIDDVVYAQAREHLFAFDAASGQLLWHRSLAADLKFEFSTRTDDISASDAIFSKWQDVLIVSFDQRMIALDLKNRSYLWMMEADTFPLRPFPLVHKGRIFLVVGPNRNLVRLQKEDAG